MPDNTTVMAPYLCSETVGGKLTLKIAEWREWFNTNQAWYVTPTGLSLDSSFATNFSVPGPTGATGSIGPDGATGPAGAIGSTGATGATGAAGVNALGSPTSRTLVLATAYQATSTAKPAIVTVNLASTAGLTLGGGTTNTADIVIGATNSVAGGTGTAVGKYANTLTGTLVVGLAINTTSTSPIVFALPTGWYFAIRQTAGTVSITSAYDQAVG